MPFKGKTASKTKSATTKKVDQVELLDKALEECNGLQNWIASVLVDVNNIKEKANKNENTENVVVVKTQKTNNRNRKNTKRNLKGKSSSLVKVEKEVIDEEKSMKIITNNKKIGKTTTEKSPKTIKTTKITTTTTSTIKETPKSTLTKQPIPIKRKQKRSKKQQKSAIISSPSLSPSPPPSPPPPPRPPPPSSATSPAKLEIDKSSIDSDYGGSSNMEQTSESTYDSIETLLDAEALSLIGRSSQECLATYSKVNKRYIEVKRSMDSLMVDLNRVNVIMNRQCNVFHGGLLSSGSKTHVCRH